MRLAIAAVGVAALFTAAAVHAAWTPSDAWLAEARCVHQHEASWTANTGNGYFGGFQFSPGTWRRVGGAPVPALAHPGDPGFPFTASAHEQLYRAWLLWRKDGRTWRSWGGVGALCSA